METLGCLRSKWNQKLYDQTTECSSESLQSGQIIGWLVQGDESEHTAATAIESLMRFEHVLASMSIDNLPAWPFPFFKTILQSGVGQRHSPHSSEEQLTEGSWRIWALMCSTMGCQCNGLKVTVGWQFGHVRPMWSIPESRPVWSIIKQAFSDRSQCFDISTLVAQRLTILITIREVVWGFNLWNDFAMTAVKTIFQTDCECHEFSRLK